MTQTQKYHNVRTKLITLLAIGTLGAITSLAAPAAFAYDEKSPSAINVDGAKLIIKGYDPVAYFAQKSPMLGDKKFSAMHDGATYYFASAENLKAFKAEPARYAPQFGGFCAMGAALGKKLDVDPTQFLVHNNKLYLNVNADVFAAFSKDVAGNVAKADGNWPTIKNKAPNTL